MGTLTHTYGDATDTHIHADTISGSRSNGCTFVYSRAGCEGYTCRYILANAHTDGHSAARGDGDANPHFNVHTGIAIYRSSIDLDGDIEVKVRRALSAPGAFRGRILNAENIGKSSRAAPQGATLAGAAHLAGCTLHGSADVCKKGYFARAAKLP